jgi:hypothetical protein
MSRCVEITGRRAALGFAAAAVAICMAGWCCAASVDATVVSPLRNGGFEDGVGEGPFSWLVSVAQAEGALSLWDDEVSRSGLRSVQLSTSTEYASEPYNNWSQNVSEPLGGKRVTVRGFIKGHNVQDAVLWLQCFHRGSSIPIAAVASNETQPLQGNFGWTEREVSLYVPQASDLVVVRMALVGTGTVWFDDIVMEVVDPEAKEPPVPDKSVTKQTAEPEDGPDELAVALESVAEENRKLRDANEQLAGQIDHLADRVQSLQTFLEEMQAAGAGSTETSLPFIIPPRNIPSRGGRSNVGPE